MVRANLRALTIAACLSLAACGTQPPPPAPRAASAPPRAIAQDERTGIAECDDYLDRYEACLATHVPQEARDALRIALQQTRATWRKSVTTSNKASMANVCNNTRAAARPSLVARGCTDF